VDDVIRVGQIEIRFRLTPADTGGSVSMFEFMIPPRARVPLPHSHDAYDETAYGLDGVMTWTLDGRTIENRPGDVLFIPHGRVHGFENRGDVPARGLGVISPGLLGPEFFREVGDIVNAGGPPDPARIGAIMRKYGLTPA
jgi:quercetin dioxygenase-like cupin family protein